MLTQFDLQSEYYAVSRNILCNLFAKEDNDIMLTFNLIRLKREAIHI